MAVKMTANRDSKLELDEEKCPSLLLSEPNVELKSQNDFGIYQLDLFAITQLGYLPVAGGMLTTTFFEPSKESCINLDPFSYSNASSSEFQSLLMEWSQHCQQSSLTIIISTIVMLGAVVGAFCSGFLADRFGRKPVVVGTMFILSLSHGALTLYAGYSQIYAFIILFTIGCVSGGYMVVNLVLLIESLENSRSRLLAVSLNGWPIGMSGVALVGYWTQNWRSYHIIMSITAAFLALILQLSSRESNRWLNERGISYDNMQKKNINIRKMISTFCSAPFLKITKRSYTINQVPSSSFLMSDIKVINTPINTEQMSNDSTESSKYVYTYFDLFRYNSVLIPLLALSYSFTSSSIISFGFYFAIEILPGNRYVNLASMGALKLSLGLLPFIFSLWFGRRPIFIISIGIACISCCILVLCETFFNSHWVITVLSLLITASMDPAWKINHLYSTELFPTPVRNMCRAVCNVGARFGSLVAPSIIYLRQQWPFFPYMIFLILLTGQLILGICLFPETRDRPMIEEISERTKEKQLKDNTKTNC